MEVSWLQQLSEAESQAERDAVMLAMSLSALSPELREALQAAAVPHWFNGSFLDALLGDESDALYDDLLVLSFVEMTPGRGYAIHELTRNQLIHELWQEESERFLKLSERAADYCAEQVALDEDEGWQAEEIYHRLVSDPSRQKVWKFIKRGLLIGLIVGLLVMLYSVSTDGDWFLGVFFLLLVVFLGGAGGLLVGLPVASIDMRPVEERPYPGQGVRVSIRNAILWTALPIMVLIFLALLKSIAFRFLFARDSGLYFSLNLVLENAGWVLANLLPLIFTLFGGLAWCQHVVLRYLLSKNDYLPRKLVPWLNEMSDLGLLRSVGGGYIFIHRSLLEYFAVLESQES